MIQLLIALCAPIAFAGTANVKVNDLDTKEDTSIVIRKGPIPSLERPPEFEIVAGEDEIEGDPAAGASEARKSWKDACAEWKKELKELNKENQVLLHSCGSPVSSLLDNGQRQYKSAARYKLKIRVRAAPTGKQ